VHRGVRRLRIGISERSRGIGHAPQYRHGIVHARGRTNDQIVGAHGVRERREQHFGVGNDRAIVSVVTVHQPGRELELGVQSSSGPQQPVGGSAARGDVCVQDIACGGGCRSQPLQVYCRVADRNGVPIDDADNGGNPAVVVQKETRGGSAAQDHCRFEAPKVIVGDCATPPRHESARHPFGVLCPVDKTRRFVSDLLRRPDHQSRLASPGHGEGMRCGQSFGKCRSHARAGGYLARVDAVAGDEARDHGRVICQGHFAEQLRCRVRQQRAHAGRERAQGPRVGAKVVARLRVRCHTDDDLSPGVERRLHGIHATRRVLGQRGDGDDVGIRRDG